MSGDLSNSCSVYIVYVDDKKEEAINKVSSRRYTMKICSYIGMYDKVAVANKAEMHKKLLKEVFFKSVKRYHTNALHLYDVHKQLKNVICIFYSYGGILRSRKRRKRSKKRKDPQYSIAWRRSNEWIGHDNIKSNLSCTDMIICTSKGVTTIKNLIPRHESMVRCSLNRDVIYTKHDKSPQKVRSLKRLARRKIRLLFLRYPSLRKTYNYVLDL